MHPIFHIAEDSAWQQAQAIGAYRCPSIDTEGFIHCSTKTQILEVAHRLFKGRQDLVLLEIDQSKVPVKIIFENLEGGSELYPHIYGLLPIEAVSAVHPFSPGDRGLFSLPF